MRSLRLLLAPFGFVLGGDLRRRIQPRLGPDGLSGHEARDGHRTFSRSVLVGLAGTNDGVLAEEWISNSRVLGRESRVKDRKGPAFWTSEESSTDGSRLVEAGRARSPSVLEHTSEQDGGFPCSLSSLLPPKRGPTMRLSAGP